jgi:hypothetical protein
MVSLCDKHSVSSPHKDRKIRFNVKKKFVKYKMIFIFLKKNRLSEMLNNFSTFADPIEVAEQLNISEDIVQRIYKYWIHKRFKILIILNKNFFRSLRNGQPLITEPEVCDTLTQNDQRIDLILKLPKNNQRGNQFCTPSTSFAAFHAMSDDHIHHNYESLRLMRLDYEKVF